MLEVLIFIYQNYWDKPYTQALKETDEAIMAFELSQAGFGHQDILHAVDWVKALHNSVQQAPYLNHANAIRIYCAEERAKISADSLSFLDLLVRSQIISAYERDVIIDRTMMLSQTDLTLADIRWVTMMVIADDTRKQDYLFVEDALFNPKGLTLQ